MRFTLLSPLATLLLTRLSERAETGYEALQSLAAEARPPQSEPFILAGVALLASLREQGALIGTWRMQ